ncbi:hypothetical protein FGB62_243g020 [Gracilaria domingensis]|nr:hypothetical protein FGB62_243g020 [Gracilaria domingensis]
MGLPRVWLWFNNLSFENASRYRDPKFVFDNMNVAARRNASMLVFVILVAKLIAFIPVHGIMLLPMHRDKSVSSTNIVPRSVKSIWKYPGASSQSKDPVSREIRNLAYSPYIRILHAAAKHHSVAQGCGNENISEANRPLRHDVSDSNEIRRDLVAPSPVSDDRSDPSARSNLPTHSADINQVFSTDGYSNEEDTRENGIATPAPPLSDELGTVVSGGSVLFNDSVAMDESFLGRVGSENSIFKRSSAATAGQVILLYDAIEMSATSPFLGILIGRDADVIRG